MKAEKNVIANLTKCYSIAPLYYRGEEHFLVAAEKKDRCLLFDLSGKLVDTVWFGPGGTMNMVQIPESDGQFLAIQKFYSPNDSREAKIVVVTPVSEGNWEVKTLAVIPHVHRFDIITRGETRYLIVCTLKSAHQYKDDWSVPGKVYAAELSADLAEYDENHQLDLTVIKEGMLKNHGYSKYCGDESEKALISSNEGVFLFTPPAEKGSKWSIEQLLSEPASDAILLDLDEDGTCELCTFSPFHGDKISVYKKRGEQYDEVYIYPEAAEFSHAIGGAVICGKPVFITGYRQGKRRLMAIYYDQSSKSYRAEIIDEGRGPANVFYYAKEGDDILIAANRETDEVAMYKIERLED